MATQPKLSQDGGRGEVAGRCRDGGKHAGGDERSVVSSWGKGSMGQLTAGVIRGWVRADLIHGGDRNNP